MSGHTHLVGRLDAQDIKHIYQLEQAGITPTEICARYHLSISSVSKILNQSKWTTSQRSSWGDPTAPSKSAVRDTRSETEKRGDLYRSDKPSSSSFRTRESVDTLALSRALLDLISACDLVREARQAALSAGARQGLITAVLQDALFSAGRDLK